MMPQTLKKVSPEYAKSFYGFVIDPLLPFKKGATTIPAPEDDKFKLIKSGGTAPPLFPEIQPDEYNEEEYNGNGKSLF
jgi:hypothetical protein